MRVGVVGGGILGMALSHRLNRLGHQVQLFEAAPYLGGLTCAHDYGPFVWDRFYHCILPQDRHMIDLLGEFGLQDELRWTNTGTGYYGNEKFYSMNGNKDFLKFPLLSLVDKVRMGAFIMYATKVADPYKLYTVSAKDWLIKLSGRRNYQVFWRPLLKAKFGVFADEIAAVFIWATLARLFGARSNVSGSENFGYVRGGYGRILDSMQRGMLENGIGIHLATPVQRIEQADVSTGRPGCHVVAGPDGHFQSHDFDQVIFTAPTALARRVVHGDLTKHVDAVSDRYPTSKSYLGVACLVLALKKPLTDYYVLNIGDDRVELTGLIEMTNLIDAKEETEGLSLVYLPRYLGATDPQLDASDEELMRPFFDRGLKRLFPDFSEHDIVYQGIHRARYVQPLPLANDDLDPGSLQGSFETPQLESPLQVLNTSMLRCATLNNNEVVGLVHEFVEKNADALVPATPAAPAVPA